MGEPKRKRADHNAGAFLSPGGLSMIPVPMSTLSDEYSDEPVDPEDDHEPEPEPLSFVHRVMASVHRVTARLTRHT